MSQFSGIPRGTLADRVYGDLRVAILDGSLPSGSELNQVGLAKEFGVSRVPVREALRRLQAENLVSVTNFHQYVVTPIDSGALVELIEIRTELEVLALRRRIADVDAQTVGELRDINSRLREEHDPAQWFNGDIDFHHVLNGPGTETAAMVRGVRERVHRFLQMVASTEDRRAEACDEHDAILDALAARDEKAAEKAIRDHIAHTRSVLLHYLTRQAAEGSTATAVSPR